MMSASSCLMAARVALLAEGVDRNPWPTTSYSRRLSSPSSRRAWIEIAISGLYVGISFVALLAEGVDRNIEDPAEREELVGRPPRGGCG